MEMIINEILEWCQNDMEYLQELINKLQKIVDDNGEIDNKLTLKDASTLLREFYYEKNGKEQTIEFLKYITKELEEAE
jgi:hypothetical protein